MKKFVACVVLIMAAGPATASDKIQAPLGQYTIEDGMTIVLQGKTVVLRHISAPPLGTTCMLKGKERDCGLMARASLMDLSAGVPITCTNVSQGLGTCTAGGFDLAENMVYTGWAVPTKAAPARFWVQMTGSKARKRGFWRAQFTPVWPPQTKALKR